MKISTLFATLLAFTPCFAQEVEIDSVAMIFERELDSLAQVRDVTAAQAQNETDNVSLNPYSYRLMVPGTYYNRPLHQAMGINWESGDNENKKTSVKGEPSLAMTNASDAALARLYVTNPTFVSRTETELREAPTIRQEAIETPVAIAPKLAEKAAPVDLEADIPDTIKVVPKKPNFWKLRGNASIQFTQSYFSDNWYQGGEKNYAGLGIVNAEANYDNKQKLQWDNKLEAQLGFQTSLNDTYHKFLATSNLLRVTSKIGYKAAKNWFYTGQVLSYTQLYPNYPKNEDKVKADFTSPLYLTISVGIDYKRKTDKYELSLYLSPVAYNMCWVARKADDYRLRKAYGMEQHSDGRYKATYHKYGPSVTVNYKMKVMKNVNWTSRFYCFGNIFDNKKDMYVLLEWENTLDFTINKYLSAKFFAYPRFDNSTRDKNNPKHAHSYFMFKEWLSLGVSYNF